MKTKYIQYYTEGEDDEKVVKTLKEDLRVIRSGKVQKFNVIERLFSDAQLRTLKPGTAVVLVFDTDTTANLEILQENLKTLHKYTNISEIITIPQVSNLEDEIVRSCNIRRITELLNSLSVHDYKSDLLRTSNLGAKLQEHKFDMTKFWAQAPRPPYQNIENLSHKIKLK